jgi:dTDP-4-amino-4,6-dideoxygalactose transaminase
MIGAFGNVTAFSFYVTKNVTTIEGGAVVTEDAALADAVETFALHGLSQGAWERFSDSGFRHYEAVAAGYKHNMTDVPAALGIHQLPRLDAWIERRAMLSEGYDEMLEGLPLRLPLRLPPPPAPESRHARHLYQVLVEPEACLSRDELLQAMNDLGIGTGVHYRAVHLHPYYRELLGLEPAAFPVATDISERTLSLPLSPALSEDDQVDVVSALRSALRC